MLPTMIRALTGEDDYPTGTILRLKDGSWGGPLAWKFTGEDDAKLQRLLKGLTEFAASPDSGEAMTSTETREEDVSGWTRDGTRQLCIAISTERLTGGWQEVRAALELATSAD